MTVRSDNYSDAAGTGAPSFTNGLSGVDGTAAAAAGVIGEYLEGLATGVATVANVAKTIASVALTDGDWEVSVFVYASFGGSGTGLRGAMSTIDNSLGTGNIGDTIGYFIGAGDISEGCITIPAKRFLLTGGPTTLYAVAETVAFAGTAAARISARRMR